MRCCQPSKADGLICKESQCSEIYASLCVLSERTKSSLLLGKDSWGSGVPHGLREGGDAEFVSNENISSFCLELDSPTVFSGP